MPIGPVPPGHFSPCGPAAPSVGRWSVRRPPANAACSPIEEATPLSTVRDVVASAASRLPPRGERFVGRLADQEVLLAGSSLAFYGLVSVVPLLLMAFAAADTVFGPDALQRLRASAPSEGLFLFVNQLTRVSASVSLVTVLFSLWPATAYGGGLRRALREMSGEDEELSGLRGRGRGLLMVLALPVVVVGGIPVTYGLTGLTGDGLLATALGWLLALVGGTLVGTAVLAVLYQLFAPTRMEWRPALAGAALAAATTAVLSLVFVVYLRFGSPLDRFGGPAIGMVVLLGVWLFAANVVLLAGYTAGLQLDDE